MMKNSDTAPTGDTPTPTSTRETLAEFIARGGKIVVGKTRNSKGYATGTMKSKGAPANGKARAARVAEKMEMSMAIA
ncbi:MAG: hypothetical protein OSA43_06015 [Pirellulales bacterium]|jgi:hypothetical protein|nr:hypothetical protein [Pirellulales bacterium]